MIHLYWIRPVQLLWFLIYFGLAMISWSNKYVYFSDVLRPNHPLAIQSHLNIYILLEP